VIRGSNSSHQKSKFNIRHSTIPLQHIRTETLFQSKIQNPKSKIQNPKFKI